MELAVLFMNQLARTLEYLWVPCRQVYLLLCGYPCFDLTLHDPKAAQPLEFEGLGPLAAITTQRLAALKQVF